jgi:hypothetical protein
MRAGLSRIFASASEGRESSRCSRVCRLPSWILVVALGLVLAAATSADAGQIRAETAEAWTTYVRLTERRIERELASGGERFLAGDFDPDRRVESPSLRAGAIDIVNVETLDEAGREIEVPAGLVHHWRGTVLMRGVTLEQVLDRVSNPTPRDLAQEDVIESRVLAREPGAVRVYLRLRRQQFVTVVYNTEHHVTWRRQGTGRASSQSVATKIAEVDAPATPDEREKPLGQDRGFLWRLNAYWRYRQVDGGVIVECESISLSRTMPVLIRATVQPIVDRVARSSMERTLASMRKRFETAASDRPSGGRTARLPPRGRTATR